MSESEPKFLLCIETGGQKTSEHQFFETILEKWNMEQNFEIRCIGGKNNLKTALTPNSKSQTKPKYRGHVFCFDMDEKTKEANREYIKEQICNYNKSNTKNKIQKYKIFLLPNNEKEGIFEDLLENIIPNKHKKFLKCCWEDFTTCIAKKNYKLPDQKAKMYSYIAAVKEDFTKKKNWGFNNTQDTKYWNLASAYLEPLQKFLQGLINGTMSCDEMDSS